MSSPREPKPTPSFESDLPAGLLEGLSQKDRHFYIKLDELGQAQRYLIERSLAQETILEQVREQTTKTNGRVLAAEADIKDLVAKHEAQEDDLKVVRVGMKVLKSRWFWIGAAAFLFFGVPFAITHAPSPAEFVQAVFGL